jgi:hypothetical protein
MNFANNCTQYVTWAIMSCSAIASFCTVLITRAIMHIHRQNLRESIRPELMLRDWHWDGPPLPRAGSSVIFFVENIGRGAAQHIKFNAVSRHIRAAIDCVMPEIEQCIPFLPSGVKDSGPRSIRLQWIESYDHKNSNTLCPVFISASYYDLSGLEYELIYELNVHLDTTPILQPGPVKLADHLALVDRNSQVKAKKHCVLAIASWLRFKRSSRKTGQES